MHDDGFDGFDWSAWADDDETVSSAGANGRHDASFGALNGHGAGSGHSGGSVSDASEEPAVGGWVTSGGVVRWEDADDGSDDPRAEAESPLAADDLELPQGAPDAPRVRAVHAWIVRQRAARQQAMGVLLLEQRELRTQEDTQEPSGRRRPRRGAHETSPLELAIAEHQAASDEYEALLATLDDLAAHSGAGQVLVEFYLWLGEHLAELAAAPEAAVASEAAHTLVEAGWRGRAHAALGTRGRVERVTAPAPEE